MPLETLALASAAALVALLYAAVGHAGASGYISVMALFGFSRDVIQPTALILNIFVACLSTAQFYRAGHFRWGLFWPFAVTSVPFAYLGGLWKLPPGVFHLLLGGTLIFSAIRFIRPTRGPSTSHPPGLAASMLTGAVLGLFAGLTGTGGGIFLTPVLLLMGWATPKIAAGTSAPFILVNSISGLAGHFQKSPTVPDVVWTLLPAVILGGWVGATIGSRFLSETAIKRCLAVVLLIAGGKLVLGL
ncbi:MAG: sulfite exporter TauE/SafE family protein [Pirellulales bacterium]|nr:sulfite exporter TauE/SafE family protein [Pirellulales bacterium]